MVDMQRVLGEIKRTAYVGVGTFGSSFIGGAMADVLPVGDLGVSGVQALAGAGVASFIAERQGRQTTTSGLSFDVNEMARHASYGVGGAGFAELADSVQSGSSSQSQSGDMIEVRTRSDASQHTPGHMDQGQLGANEEISVDV